MHRLDGFGFYTLIGNSPRECVRGCSTPKRERAMRQGREVRGMQLGHGASYAISDEQRASSGQLAMNRSKQEPVWLGKPLSFYWSV